MSKTFSIGGIHPNDSKFSKDVSIVDLPVPERVFLPMNQHLGIPAAPVVKKGDTVLVGQVVAEAAGFVSASHSRFCERNGNRCRVVSGFSGQKGPDRRHRDGRRRLAGYYRQNGTGETGNHYGT